MAMLISVGEGSGPPGAGWSVSEGVFDCIVEATRKLFKDDEVCCLNEIYSPLDDQGQNFIVLDYVDVRCFNLFYSYCKRAMEDFPRSERGGVVPESHIPGILWNWAEVLRLRREDSRYRTFK
ncbi:hypothetical protein RAS12_02245 [Achromobacter seleniivolatilans]|uniref:Uncharacterized protein n=1 Tax=Achromobacter seleniivolatilans TaxID=3047478 RepID=A0ABY9M3C3_9BURK|nr:hypothetical protein [Achromobacter sp. R39]WMD21210.1 hypothetical protein RAS12_02245 [Achromobacter sp. R39]